MKSKSVRPSVLEIDDLQTYSRDLLQVLVVRSPGQYVWHLFSEWSLWSSSQKLLIIVLKLKKLDISVKYIWCTFLLSSVQRQGHFGVILCTFIKIVTRKILGAEGNRLNLKVTDTVVTHEWGIFDILVFKVISIWGSFDQWTCHK